MTGPARCIVAATPSVPYHARMHTCSHRSAANTASALIAHGVPRPARSRRRTALGLTAAALLTAVSCADSADTPSAATAQIAPASAADAIPDIRLVPAFPKLSFVRPVFLASSGQPVAEGEREWLFVLEQPGRIVMFPNDQDVDAHEIFLDLTGRVYDHHNEEGLLSLAFHPRFRENGEFFLYYSANGPRRGVVSRFRVMKDDPRRGDPESEQVILSVDQPWGNHNGSTILFGPDGCLYISLGDGGWANDPLNSGQDLSTLLGTILRIDVDSTDADRAYAIPKDNPFVARSGARPEIWAWGLRNVWRMSFDRATGELWAGDVGQNQWEEIDLIVKGGNYGWKLREGFHPFADGTADGPLIDPVVAYGRREGISVTGGYVYRGTRSPSLQGVYLYADYASRRLWGLRHRDGRVVSHRLLVEPGDGRYVASFGEDAAGEVYICTFDQPDRRNVRGRLFRIVTRDGN